jgi:hypothetical protein
MIRLVLLALILTTPAHAERFCRIIREQFVKIYEENDVLAQVAAARLISRIVRCRIASNEMDFGGNGLDGKICRFKRSRI